MWNTSWAKIIVRSWPNRKKPIQSNAHAAAGRRPKAPGSAFARWTRRRTEPISYIFDDHDQKRQLDAERLFLLARALDVRGGHVCSHYLQDRALDVCVGDPLYVPVPHVLAIPYLKRFWPIVTVSHRTRNRLATWTSLQSDMLKLILLTQWNIRLIRTRFGKYFETYLN